MNWRLFNADRIYHDIEVYSNFFCNGVQTADGESFIFMVNPFTGQNDLFAMAYFYEYVEFEEVEVISGNGLHYDTPVLNYILANYRTWCKTLTCAEICQEIKTFSNLIFAGDDWWKCSKEFAAHRKTRWVEVDLFRYWSPNLRKMKAISVKKLGIQINFPVVQDLPLDPDKPIQESDIPKLLTYNLEYDGGILVALMKATFNWQGQKSSFEEMLQLRKDAVRKYGFPKACYSWDSVKLGVEVLIQGLTSAQRAKLLDKSRDFTIKDIKHPKIQFEEEECSVWYDKKDEARVASCFKAMLDDLEPRHIEEIIAYRIHHHNTVYDLKKGGLHSRNKPILYGPRKDCTLHTIDVASYYPTLGALFDSVIAKKIGQVKDERLQLKARGLGKTPDANLLKLGLNGGIGRTEQEGSDIENPRFFYSITMNGQMMLLMLVEQVTKLPGVEVVVANTDGIELYVPANQEENFKKVCKKWEAETTMELEYDTYEKIVMLNVNNYLAFPTGGREPKAKGLFVKKPDLGNSCDFLIVPQLLEQYYRYGIAPEIAIDQIPFNIFDYCGSQKVGKKFQVVLGGKILPQRLNRYYISEEGESMHRLKEGKTMVFPKLSGYGVCLYNNAYVDEIKPIYKPFYIKKVNDVINQIQSRSLTLFG